MLGSAYIETIVDEMMSVSHNDTELASRISERFDGDDEIAAYQYAKLDIDTNYAMEE